MAIDQYNHFVALVAGDNPEVLMSPYDKNIKTEPRVVYKFADAGKLRNQYIKLYTALVESDTIPEGSFKEDAKDKLAIIQNQSDTEFYLDLTEDYEHDKDTGDALTTENPDGKWSSYRMGKLFSIPFILNDGTESFQAKKGDINWELMHLHGGEIYRRAWEMVMDGSEPVNDYEKQIYDNMKARTAYFEKFGTKENYVLSNTAFWAYAFVTKTGNWLELEDDMDQFTWVGKFYESFIDPLPDDTLLTIYECTK
jgi:hypothetical protein